MHKYEDMFIQAGKERSWITGVPEKFTIRYKGKFIDEEFTFTNRTTLYHIIQDRVGDIDEVKGLLKLCREQVVFGGSI